MTVSVFCSRGALHHSPQWQESFLFTVESNLICEVTLDLIMIKSQLCNTVPPQMGLVYLLSPVGSLSALSVCVSWHFCISTHLSPSMCSPILLHSSPRSALWSRHRAQEGGPPASRYLPGPQFTGAGVHTDRRSAAKSAASRCVHQRCLPAACQ